MRWFNININSKTIEKIASKRSTSVLISNANQDSIFTIKLANKFKESVNKIIYNSYQECLNNYKID